MPTLLAIAGAPIPGCVDGKALLDAAPRGRAGAAEPARRTPLRADRPIPPITCWRGEYKYIWYSHTGREQLFNLAADPQGSCAIWRAKPPARTDAGPAARAAGTGAGGQKKGYSDRTRLIAGRPPVTVLRHPKL